MTTAAHKSPRRAAEAVTYSSRLSAAAKMASRGTPMAEVYAAYKDIEPRLLRRGIKRRISDKAFAAWASTAEPACQKSLANPTKRMGRSDAAIDARRAEMRRMALNGETALTIAEALGYTLIESVRLALASGKILTDDEYITWRDATGTRARRGGRKLGPSGRNSLASERVKYGRAPSIFAIADAIALEMT